ncbi:NTF2-related export protein-like [Drosophila novamexicana]|uniref:NTF2-related export protein-like n=1 Tax=Drosophila novamexicana TaxID=47314 RepID=UPI0011E58C9F|nr:NTF2-related export protein-like [Drosophila novamexicana]
MNNELKANLELCGRTAVDFTGLYYAFLDNRRDEMGYFYLDNAKLTWNGMCTYGRNAIEQKFLELPSSHHELKTLDALPMPASIVGNQLTTTILVGGIVQYPGQPMCTFNQVFLVTSESDKWKISSDLYRVKQPIN